MSATRLRRAQRAFVASRDLQPMAQQLLENPTPAAYAGVESYARRHAQEDSGALAWLASGHAHFRAGEFDKAVAVLKNARVHAGEVSDYVTYFLGSAYLSAGDAQNAAATLKGFEQRYPDSLFARDAAVNLARALDAIGEHGEAAGVLTAHRRPVRADVELALARALISSGETARAIPILRNLYYNMPLAAEAAAAGQLLQAMPGVTAASFSERRTRADLLADGRRFQDAIHDYRELLRDSAGQSAAHAELELALARTLYRNGDDREARSALEQLTLTSSELNAERLYYLGQIARFDNDESRFLGLLQQLREAAPNSRWLERALLSAANMYLLKPDYDRAIDFYRELRDRFPQGSEASYAHWKAAWLAFRQGRHDEAKREFEQQIARYPGSAEVPAALYWRARLAEEDHDTARAWVWYQKLLERFPNYYYADRARERMEGLSRPAELSSDPVLNSIPPISLPSRHAELPDPPADDIRLQKARLLQNAELYDFAARELQSAADDGAAWAPLEIARMYTRGGLYFQALRTVKRTIPAYFSVDLDALPRPYWESLFPKAYWDELERFSASNHLDPFLVASLIRQESEFNPAAVSRANAYGLMQLLPSTGRNVARELGLRRFSASDLLVPASNLRLGIRHFRELLDHFNGQTAYALAAYNAGSNRVENWLASGNYRDVEEFIESIPFTETRQYVQAILRNAVVYRKLYEGTERVRTQNASAISAPAPGRQSAE